jgi:rSAM/selenodomain-associated transferase 1
MARYPELGKTKTRLARTLGDGETVRLYQVFLHDLAQRFAAFCRLHWAYTPAEVDYQAFVATLAPAHAQQMVCFPQQGCDLGARLHHAFRWTEQHGFACTIVIGSDSPHIGQKVVSEARAALDEADVVLGPAEDGGYYLIAMRKPYDVFSGIPMSTSVVAQMTIALAQQQGLKVRLLELLLDVDEFADLQRLARLLAADCTLAPLTATYLTTMRSLFNDAGICTNAATLNLY